MLKSMTGFSRCEAKENGITATVEVKTLNGRYLEFNCRLPRQITHKELEIREQVRKVMERGSVTIMVNIETDDSQVPFDINMDAAAHALESLGELKKKLKIRETIKFDHILHFSNHLMQKDDDTDIEVQWKVVKKALINALKDVDKMRKKEGQQIGKDITARMAKMQEVVDEIEGLGLDRIPDERERLRQRVAQLFESDEIDEQRLQMEMVLLADKLDISEECVRLNSHFKFFEESIISKTPSGKKLNFLLQEMHREINTIGSKANDAKISQLVVDVKEELEKVREQVQNIE